jgi:hypothetical protein
LGAANKRAIEKSLGQFDQIRCLVRRKTLATQLIDICGGDRAWFDGADALVQPLPDALRGLDRQLLADDGACQGDEGIAPWL